MKQSKVITEMQNKFFNAGFSTGKQIAADIFEIAMHDCGINPKLIAEVADRAMQITPENERALNVKRDPEADVFQYHIDERLKRIFGDRFQPWSDRYDWLRKVRY